MTSAPRFYSQGGQLFADRRPVSLEWAETKLLEWADCADREYGRGNLRLAAEYERQVRALQDARREVWRWQRASGPNAAEAYTNKVREMLKASLQQ